MRERREITPDRLSCQREREGREREKERERERKERKAGGRSSVEAGGDHHENASEGPDSSGVCGGGWRDGGVAHGGSEEDGINNETGGDVGVSSGVRVGIGGFCRLGISPTFGGKQEHGSS